MSKLNFLQTIIIAVLFFSVPLFAGNSGCLPDSMEEITVSGTVIVDNLNNHLNYFLDADADAVGDYKLNFGPFWYQPDSSDAVRPVDGDYVEIYGFLNICKEDSLLSIIVLEINGEFWRDLYEPTWNRLGKDRNRHRNSYRNHKGFAFGWLNDSLEIVEIEGVTLVDTTTHFWHYYLDVDEDTIPDYFLNFGPPWYEPASGLEKPSEGETVTILGALVEKNKISVLFVFELNGEVWIDSTGLGSQMGGGWIHKTMNQERKIEVPFDSLSHIQVRQGWNDGQPKGSGNLPDSLFCQMLQLFPQNIPYAQQEQVLAGFEIGLFTAARNNLMLHRDSVGVQVKFATKLHYQFHYSDIQVEAMNRNENTLRLKLWNHEGQKWEEVEDAVVDTDQNMVSFESETIPSLVILTAEQATAMNDADDSVIREFVLKQNYPNPFNPSTTIEFSLNREMKVVLSVYNVLGQKLFDFVNGKFNAGSHLIQFDASILTSGIYFYELKTEHNRQVMKMTVLK